MKKLAIIIALIILSAANLPAAEVKNVQSSQVGNRVQFTYDLTGEGREAEVTGNLTVRAATARQAISTWKATWARCGPAGAR